jgi:hypothetical protein
MTTKAKKMKWVKATPEVEGWYWIKYKNKRNCYTVCPCYVTIFRSRNLTGNLVHTARNDTFIEGPSHGGWGLKYNGKPCPDIRFGDKIEEPT